MELLRNLKISTKIVALVLALGALTTFVGWRGASRMMSIDADYSRLIDRQMADAVALARVNRSLQTMMYSAYQTLAYDGRSSQARAAASTEKESYDSAKRLLADVDRNEPELKERTAQVAQALDRVHTSTAAAIALGLADRNREAQPLLREADAEMHTLRPLLVSFGDQRIAAADAASTTLSEQSGSTSTALLVISLVSVVAGVGVALLVTRYGIAAPLGRLQAQMREIAGGDYAKPVEGVDRGDEVGAMAKAVQVFRENGIAKDAADKAKARADAEQTMVVDTVSSHLSRLSDGDLTAAIATDFPGEYVALKTNFNEAIARLRELIGSVTESAATIRTGSGEIAQASEDLARRTESNAASLEETAASITQIDNRLRASATAANRTVERADQAIATVGGGRAVADEAVQAMGRVSDSAKGIDSVIEGLDKIAFQTRVLAMNAAVEAGRAGDAGRGFAVVADLVSALAMRAEEEAKRARDQLTVTQTDIVTAVDAVTKVDGALAAISGDVTQVHELLASMAQDNQAQSAAITQISAAIGTMDQSTQQNAAMVEQTSAAARNLTSEVMGLNEQASRFTTGIADRTIGQRRTSVDFAGPVKPLPAAAIPALIRQPVDADDWQSF